MRWLRAVAVWPGTCDRSGLRDYIVTTAVIAAIICGHVGLPELAWYWNLAVAVWFWLFGANVGSFMNVVVYRLPLRSSITLPRSRCPRCRHKIRWFDNIPVFSWLALRGRCRDCHEPISLRYPLVELLVATVFVVLAFVEPLGLGGNLPEPLTDTPMRLLRQQTVYSLGLLCAYQLLLWCTLACAALISFDGQAVPWRLFAPVAVIGSLAPLVWPSLRPVPAAVPMNGPPWWIAAGEGLAGVVVGAALGLFVVASARYRRRPVRNPAVIPLAVGGLVVGWQAVCALAVGAVMVEFVASLLGGIWRAGRRVPLTAPLCLLLLAYICFWDRIVSWVPALHARANVLTFAVAGAVVSLLSSAQSWLGRRRRVRWSPDPLIAADAHANPPASLVEAESFVAQGFDGVHARRADGRVEAEQEADADGDSQ
jgi:prepilin signal peptidase PulO-like enzyme (type II secretory pathway)